MSLGDTIKKRWQIIVAVIAAVAVVIGTYVAVNASRPQTQGQSPGPSTSSSSPAASPKASRDPALVADCKPLGKGFEPTRFTMEQPSANEKILSLGYDKDGNIAAPPGDEPRTASWWNDGPKAGSQKGKVVLSIHTYRRGGALGNEMYANDKPLMDKGDVIKLYGDNGQVACYEFAEAMKVKVDEYDPDSDIMVDHTGKPRLLIIICSDQVAGKPAASRIFFYADPIDLAA